MGFIGFIKEKATRAKGAVEQDLSKGSDSVPGRVGRTIGNVAARFGTNIKAKYNQRYGGGEYRAARIREYNEKRRELQAKNAVAREKRMLRENRAKGFRAALGIPASAKGKRRAKPNPFGVHGSMNNYAQHSPMPNYDAIVFGKKKKR